MGRGRHSLWLQASPGEFTLLRSLTSDGWFWFGGADRSARLEGSGKQRGVGSNRGR